MMECVISLDLSSSISSQDLTESAFEGFYNSFFKRRLKQSDSFDPPNRIHDYPSSFEDSIAEIFEKLYKVLEKHKSNSIAKGIESDIFEIFREEYKDKYIKMNSFYEAINKIKMLDADWSVDFNAALPNDFVFKTTKEIIPELIDCGIEPYRIAPTVEEGICLQFKNGCFQLFLEIYNDGDIGYIIEDTSLKTAVKNENITKDEILSHLQDFYFNL